MSIHHLGLLTIICSATGLLLGRCYPIVSIVMATMAVAGALCLMQFFQPLPVGAFVFTYLISAFMLQGGFLIGKLTSGFGPKRLATKTLLNVRKH